MHTCKHNFVKCLDTSYFVHLFRIICILVCDCEHGIIFDINIVQYDHGNTKQIQNTETTGLTRNYNM